MRRRRSAAAVLGLGAILLALSWRWLPGASPPLYDGLCIVSPYQYLSPAPGTPAPKATEAAKSLDVSAGQPSTELITGETPPQATLDLGEGTLAVPSGVNSVKLSIKPVPPPSTQPDDGHIDGNVYRFEARTEQGAPVAIASGRKAEVLLRPTAAGGATKYIEQLADGRWTRLDTSLMTCADTQAAVTKSLGDFAVVVAGPGGGGSGGAGGDSGGGVPVGLLLAGGAVLVVGGAVAVIRLKRRSAQR